MIVCEAGKMNFVDEIIDVKDSNGLTPLYLLCEEGFRKKYDVDDEEEALALGMAKTAAEELLIADANDGLESDHPSELDDPELDDPAANRERPRRKQVKSKVQELLAEGLYYTTAQAMLQLIDDECTKPSRNYITKLLIEQGANPNIQSPEVLHTPLHWLAYWGDHRAVKVLLELNSYDLIQPKGCCQSPDKYIKKFGAFNAFQTKNGQTPVDIAGDLNNFRCVKAMVEHFLDKEEDNIRRSFITPALVKKFEPERFDEPYKTKQIEFSRNDTKAERIKLAFIKSAKFSKQ